jgi:hypothetical protein
MEMHGTARLAEEIPAERAVATLVPRDEIAGALADPAHSPELYLDVTRGEEEGTIGISWSHDELEQLLADAQGGDVVLTFDRDELQTIFDDVEAHGLREKGLVFAVAAAGALGSGATIANAAPALDHASSGASVATVQTLAAESAATDAGASSNVRTPGLQIGDEPATIATPSAKLATARATNADAGTPSNVHTPGLQIADTAATAGTSPGGVATGSSSGEFLGITSRDVTDGVIAGAVLLAIAGATFAGSRRTGTTRPA